MRFPFLILTFITLPFSVRKVFFENFSGGTFNEYLDVSLYLFEVLALIYILFYILENKIDILSIYRKHMFHVEHIVIVIFILSLSTIFATVQTGNPLQSIFIIKILLYGVFFVFFKRDLSKYVPRGTNSSNIECSTWNNLYQNTQKIVSRGTIIQKIYQICSTWNIFNKNNHQKSLFIATEASVPRGTLIDFIVKKCSTWNIIAILFNFNLFFQLYIVIFQLLKQKSIGLIFFGEAVLNPSIAGVATVIINGEEFLRGYGTFLHPNILALFIFINLLLYYLFIIVPRGTIVQKIYQICSTMPIGWQAWNIFNKNNPQKSLFIATEASVPRGTLYYSKPDIIFIIFSCLVIVLSFSKSLIFLTVLFLVFIIKRKTCSTWNTLKSLILSIVVFMAAGVALGHFLIDIGWVTYLQQSILERKIQYLSILNIPLLNILTGLGYGGYVSFIANTGLYLPWQLQPIHNVLILAILEIGFIQLIIASFLLYPMFKSIKKSIEESVIRSVLICYLLLLVPLLFIDHYFWDLEQSIFILGIFLTSVLVVGQSPLYTKKVL